MRKKMRAAVLVDSSPLVACFDRDDEHHRRCQNWLANFSGELITTPAVITEICHLLMRRIGVPPAIGFVRWADQAMTCDQDMGRDLASIAAIMDKYQDLPPDFADASLVALANRRGLFQVATLDKDFTIYRGDARQRLVNTLDGYG
jgi:uncharacterized protein